MTSSVYKTDEVRSIIEANYQKLLSDHLEPRFEQIFISTQIGKIHILKFGSNSNPPLVMLHGSMSNSATWLGTASFFTNNFCIYCIDIPGEPGLSEPHRVSLNSQNSSAWLKEVLDKIGVKKCFIVSMSLGSWYAMKLSIENPERVCALSMITACGIAPQKISFIFKAILYLMLGKFGQNMLNKAVYHNTQVSPQALLFQSIVSKHFSPVTEIVPIFTDDQLRKMTHPTQYFGGDHDALLNTQRTAERLNNLLADIEVNVLKDTGHVIIDQFNKIESFLTSKLSQ